MPKYIENSFVYNKQQVTFIVHSRILYTTYYEESQFFHVIYFKKAGKFTSFIFDIFIKFTIL